MRGFLQKAGYRDWLSIPVVQGKDKSLSLLGTIPQYPEVDMLRNYLREASKWAVIIGHDGQMCRWSDITHGGPKTQIEAEFVVKNFS